MNKNLVRLCHTLLAVLLLLHLHSCKDPVVRDKGITSNPEDNINLSHVDTTTIILNTENDLALTSGTTVGVLGSMDDQLLGRTFSSIYAQCLLYQQGVIPFVQDSAPATVDSAVLYMPFVNDSSFYGRCSKPVDILVYELSDALQANVVYNTRDAFTVFNQPIGIKTNYLPDLIDSPVVNGTTMPPMLSIPLKQSFAQKLFNSDSTALSSYGDFVNYVKGIYITTNSAKIGNGVMYFLLQSSYITMYYHTRTGTQKPILFPISQYSIVSEHFDHLFSAAVQSAIANPANNTTAYIQAGSGTRVRLRMPYIKNITHPVGTTDTSIAITKAELIVPVGDTNSYPPPGSLKLYRIDSTVALQTLNSYNYSGTGTLTTRLDNMGNPYLCYVFNLTEHIQRILNNYYNNNGFYLEYSYTASGSRIVIKNDPSAYASQTKLKITYTKLK